MALTPGVISGLIEKPCSWPRSWWISALRQSLRWHSLPNGASRTRFVPKSSTLSAPLPFFFSARCCPRAGQELVSRRPPDPTDPALALAAGRSAFGVVRLRFSSVSFGRSRSSLRCGTPRCRNSRANQTGQDFGKPAKKLLEHDAEEVVQEAFLR